MVLARRLEEGLERVREQRRAEGRAEGVAEGRVEGMEEADRAWRAWNARRLEAEAADRPFTEPPPDIAPPADNGAH